MTINNIAAKFLVKYADLNPELEEDAPPTKRYPVQTAPVSTKDRARDIVAIEHLISVLLKNDIYSRGEASYFYKMLERNESSKHILSMLKSRLDDAQKKITDSRKEIAEWQHLVK